MRINNITLKDCIFNGRADDWGYETTTFDNVTFNAPGTKASGIAGTNYSLWTYTGNTYTFKNCTFNSTGKTINVYRHNAEQFTSDVTINYESCTVINTAHKKQAMKINDSTTGEKCKYIINISGKNAVTGIEPNAITCSRLFGFDEEKENAGHTQVNINGETVWEGGKRQVAHNCNDIVAGDAGSYTNGVDGSDASVLYTDGYKDDAFTTSYGSWYWDQSKNQLACTVTKTCKYCGEEVKTTKYKDLELDVSRSKTAIALDSSNQSTVTLSLPSAEEQLASDIVFVLDKSNCKKETGESVAQMLTELQNQVKSSGSKIQVGVVVFGGDAKISYPLSTFPTTDDALNTLQTALTTRPDGLMSGTNMHAGLLAAQEMLKNSTTDNNRKYVILVSDGLPRLFTGSDGKTKDIYYQYSIEDKLGSKQVGSENNQIHPKDCFYYGMIGEWVNVRTQSTSDSTYAIPYGNWGTYFSKVKEWVKADGDYYALDFETYGNDPTSKVKNTTTGEITDSAFKYIGHTDYESHAMSVDRAVYEAYNSFTGMVDSGYHCYAVLSGSGTPFGTAFMGAMNEYAKNGSVDFTGIGNDIFYAVGAGSTVEDKMGADFNFVTGSLKLTVGGNELASKTEGNVTYFGDSADALSETNYRFKVLYDPTNDAFAWTINEDVSNFAPVQLSYQVKLVNRNTAAGTYKVFTNEYATLTPMNSAGQVGKELEFDKPEVSYTVKGSSGGHSGGGGGKKPSVDIPDDVPSGLDGDDHFAYIIGRDDGKVHPEAEITRAEVATIFFRLLTEETRTANSTQVNSYSDVDSDRWYNHAISTLSKMGIIKGTPQGTFNPDAFITRAEFAAIAARFDDKNTDTSSNFSDILSHWAKDEIGVAANKGWVNGYTDGTFRPNQYITCAEAMTLVNRVLNRLPENTSDLLDGMIQWPDNQNTSAWYYLAVQEATNSHDYEAKSTENKYETWTKLNDARNWAEMEH